MEQSTKESETITMENKMKNGLYYNPETLQLYEIFKSTSSETYFIFTTKRINKFEITMNWMTKKDLKRSYKKLNLKYLGEF